MKIAEKVERKLRTINEGATFKYTSLGIAPSEYATAAKAMERLIRKGAIRRASTGIFYKPKQTVFGELQPREEELLKPYLFENGKRIAYVTGASLYNRMGLTTQIPKSIQVACQAKRIVTKIGTTQVRPIKSYVEVTEGNYQLLELLDAIKDFKEISDLDRPSAILLLKGRLNLLTAASLAKLLKYALKYPPRARALLGALAQGSNCEKEIKILRDSLNPFTIYELGITDNMLSTASNWNIL
jgi:Family of unknown function (DUF6088)